MSDTVTRPVGRPSQYKPEYCDLIIEKQSEGWSLAEFAAHVGVARQTVENWAADHEEFLDAKTRAKAAEQSWWERVGREALNADRFQAAVWGKTMAARFRDDYTERRETALSGTVAVEKIERVIVDPSNPPDTNR